MDHPMGPPDLDVYHLRAAWIRRLLDDLAPSLACASSALAALAGDIATAGSKAGLGGLDWDDLLARWSLGDLAAAIATLSHMDRLTADALER